MASIYELAKTVSLKSYMLSRGIEFKGDGHGALAYCPFHDHDHQTPSLGVKTNNGEEFFNCFACSTAGDIIKFVERLDGLSPIRAAEKICVENDIPCQIGQGPDEAKTDASTRQEQERIEKYQQRRKKELLKEQEARDKARQRLATEAPRMAECLAEKYTQIREDIVKLFPNQSVTFVDWQDTYLGWDVDHDSLVIINREGGEYFNTKHRSRYVWDKQAKGWSDRRADGKWLMNYHGTVYPFPMDYFRQHPSDMVIVTEGEKDALNLLSYDVNCLTLGGATNSWKEKASLLQDKTVYIWFDHDGPGYRNAIKQYDVLEAFAKDIFIVTSFTLGGGLAKGFDISDWLVIHSDDINSAQDVFDKISYSSSKLTNELIDQMSEVLDEDLDALKRAMPSHDMEDIKKVWMMLDQQGRPINVVRVNGELDEQGITELIEQMRELKRSDKNDAFKSQIAYMFATMKGLSNEEAKKESEKMLDAMSRAMDLKKSMLNSFRQTHVVDIVDAFIQMTVKSGLTLGEYRGKLAVWSGTHYQIVDDIYFSKFIHNEWMPIARVDYKKQTKMIVDQVIENLKSRSIDINEIKKRQTRRVITLLNGTVFIGSSGKITFKSHHDKRDASTHLLTFEYDRSARCPKWTRFLDRVLPDEDDQKTLMEFFGYCLLPNHDYEAFLFLYGKSGANGKSVILDVMRSFFGQESVSALQLQQFHGHELHALDNKLLNIGSEIDPRGLDKGQLSTLKALVSPKDSIQINPKMKDSYPLLADQKPKLAFSGNSKPKKGLDDAIFRRMLLLSFDEEISDDEKIRDLSDRFNDEKDGIFNMILEAMERLVRNGKFSKSDRMRVEIEAYKDDIDPVRSYIKENIQLDPSSMVDKKMLYQHYKTWCIERGHRQLTVTKFINSLQEAFPDIDKRGQRVNLDGKRPYFIQGLYCSTDVIEKVLDENGKEVQTKWMNRSIGSQDVLIDI